MDGPAGVGAGGGEYGRSGRCLDNVFVERLWRTVKYEDVYLRGYEAVPALSAGWVGTSGIYNEGRLHQSLDYRTPWEAYRGGRPGRGG